MDIFTLFTIQTFIIRVFKQMSIGINFTTYIKKTNTNIKMQHSQPWSLDAVCLLNIVIYIYIDTLTEKHQDEPAYVNTW